MASFVSKLSPEQWAEARGLRAQGSSFAAIADKFGLTPNTIRARANREGWDRSAAAAAGVPARKAPARNARLSPASPTLRAGLAHRLYRIVDTKLKIMELRVRKQLDDATAGEGDLSLNQQDAADLASIIKTIHQATELEADADPRAGGAPGAKSADARARASEADALRHEIAERIETLIPPA
jgi:hypothetical protein